MEYVPRSVYIVVRTGLSANRQWRVLYGLDGYHQLESVYDCLQLHYRVDCLVGACLAGFDVEDIKTMFLYLDWQDTKRDRRESMLSAASRSGHLDIVRYILETLGVPDVVGPTSFEIVGRDDCWERTPFMWACNSGHLDIVKYLYETIGIADVNDVDAFGMKPFMMACEYGHMDIVKYLYETVGNVDVNDEDKNERTTFMIACKSGAIDVVKYLNETIDNLDVTARDGHGRTALMIACSVDIDITKYICETIENVDVNEQDMDGSTALMYACRAGLLEVFGICSKGRCA